MFPLVYLHFLCFFIITERASSHGVRYDSETDKKKNLKMQRNLPIFHLLRNSETSGSLTDLSKSTDFGDLSSSSNQEKSDDNAHDDRNDDHKFLHHLFLPPTDSSYAMTIATAEDTYTLMMSYDFSPTDSPSVHVNNSISPTTSKSSFYNHFSPSAEPTVSPTHFQASLHSNISSASMLPSLSPSYYKDHNDQVINKSPLPYVASRSPFPSGLPYQSLANIPSRSHNITISPSMTMKPSYLSSPSVSSAYPYPSSLVSSSTSVIMSSVPSVSPAISMKPTSSLNPASSWQPISLISSPSLPASEFLSGMPSILFSPMSSTGSIHPSLANNLSSSIASSISPVPTAMDSNSSTIPSVSFTPSLSLAPTSSRAPVGNTQQSGLSQKSFTPSRLPLKSPIPSIYPISIKTEFLNPSFSLTPSQTPTRSMIPSALPIQINTFMPSSTSPSKESRVPSMLPTFKSSEEPSSIPSSSSSTIPSDVPTMIPTIKPTKSFHLISTPSLTEFPSYTVAPSQRCNLSDEEREAAITNQLMQVTDSSQLLNANTPQNSALNWIIHEDFDYYACPYDKDLIQRYIMAVLYFSTGGDKWLECNGNIMNNNCPKGENFLSGVSECEWGGSSCTNEGAVFNVTFGTFMVINGFHVENWIYDSKLQYILFPRLTYHYSMNSTSSFLMLVSF